jgi:hypothetical protein
MVVTVAGHDTHVGSRPNDDMSSFRACCIMYDSPRVESVGFAAFHIRPIAKPSSFKDGLPSFDQMNNGKGT